MPDKENKVDVVLTIKGDVLSRRERTDTDKNTQTHTPMPRTKAISRNQVCAFNAFKGLHSNKLYHVAPTMGIIQGIVGKYYISWLFISTSASLLLKLV